MSLSLLISDVSAWFPGKAIYSGIYSQSPPTLKKMLEFIGHVFRIADWRMVQTGAKQQSLSAVLKRERVKVTEAQSETRERSSLRTTLTVSKCRNKLKKNEKY